MAKRAVLLTIAVLGVGVATAVVAVRAVSQPSAPSFAPVVDAWLSETGTPGVSVGVWRQGEPPMLYAAGVARSDTAAEMSTSHRFRIGSVTKTFVAAAVLRLVQEDKVELDEPAARHISMLPAEWNVTIRHLLAHRSGVPEYNEVPAFVETIGADLGHPIATERILELVLPDKPSFRPGARFQYSGTNYLLLGLLVEQVEGKPLADVLHARFLLPLQLHATALPGPRASVPGMASGYSTRWAHLFDEDVVATSHVPQEAIASAAWAEGGMVSDARDLLQWAGALFGGDVLSPTLRDAMIHDGAETSPYGLGAYRMTTPSGPAVGHGGVFFGYQAELRYFPQTGTAVVVLTNTDNADLKSLTDRLTAAVQGPEARTESDPESLLSDLQHGNAVVRRKAALRLGETGNPILALPALIKALDTDPSPAVRAAAALAIGLAGRTDPTAAVAALQAASNDDSPEVREAAGQALQVLQ